jgi:hypothetical protein
MIFSHPAATMKTRSRIYILTAITFAAFMVWRVLVLLAILLDPRT